MPLIPHDSATPVEMFPGVVRRTADAGRGDTGGRRRRPDAHPPPRADRLPGLRPLPVRAGGREAGAWAGRLLAGALQPAPPGDGAGALRPRRYLLAATGGVPLSYR